MRPQFDNGTYYCIQCEKEFNADRDHDNMYSVTCPSCHHPNDVVKYNHPFVKILKK